MANWSGVAVSAQEITDRNAGFPLAFGKHAGDNLVISGTPSKWVAGANGNFAGSDVTASDSPVRWVADRRGYKRSKPNAASTNHTLLLNLGTTAPDIDLIVIWGYVLTVSTIITITIADSTDFLTNPQQIATFTLPAGGKRDKRIVLAQLTDGTNAEARLSDVQYIRFEFSAASQTPEIGEIWLARRRQFWENPLAGSGFSPNMLGSLRSDSGPGQSTTRYVRARAQKTLRAAFRTTDSAEVQLIKDLWDDSEQGTKPMGWILDASTTTLDDDAHIVLPDNEILEEPVGIGEFIRDVRIDGTEQKPFLALEVVPP